MAQKMYVLPIKCKGCNAIFDLWYDLERQGTSMEVILEDREMERFLNQSFCWRCRQAVKKGFGTEDDRDYASEDELELEFE